MFGIFRLCGAIIVIPFSLLGFPPARGVRLGLDLPVRPLWGAVLFGEGFELQRVKGVFTTSHILHSVLSPAALTVEKHKQVLVFCEIHARVECNLVFVNGKTGLYLEVFCSF